MNDQNRSKQEEPASLNRRMLLRTGGAAVVAGVAGLGVIETVTASAAEASPNSPVILGTPNDSEAMPTSLTSRGTSGPTLTVGNTGGVAALRLKEAPLPAATTGLASGDLANFDGNLYYTAGTPSGPLPGLVYSEFTANQLVPINPHRVLDTRSAAGRANIVNAKGNLDPAGRLLGGHTIEVSLAELAFAAQAAYCNLTAVSPLSGGDMTVWPGGTRPGTSSINFAKGAVIANCVVTGVSAADTVFIFSVTTTHVVLDVTAFAVGSPGQVNPAILPAVAARTTKQGLAARAKAGTAPKWYVAR